MQPLSCGDVMTLISPSPLYTVPLNHAVRPATRHLLSAACRSINFDYVMCLMFYTGGLSSRYAVF